jgi:hypothetical protein
MSRRALLIGLDRAALQRVLYSRLDELPNLRESLA